MNNYNKLLGRVKEYCGTNREFAKALSISEQSLYKKLYRGTQFTQNEINRAINVLHIKPNEIMDIFFTKEVEKN